MRPTHRITIWQGPSSRPVTLPAYLDGDKLREDVTGDALVTREPIRADAPLSDCRWHWTGCDRSVTAFDVQAVCAPPQDEASRLRHAIRNIATIAQLALDLYATPEALRVALQDIVDSARKATKERP